MLLFGSGWHLGRGVATLGWQNGQHDITLNYSWRNGWTPTYLGDKEWRWDSEPYGIVVNVGWAWKELKDAGEELPEAVNCEDGDLGLQSQEL